MCTKPRFLGAVFTLVADEYSAYPRQNYAEYVVKMKLIDKCHFITPYYKTNTKCYPESS